MPLHDYRCPKCGALREDVLTFNSNPSAVLCLKCWTVMDRLVGAPHPHFKGSGFYETDYKRKDEPKDEL